jgi:hypothetical protein
MGMRDLRKGIEFHCFVEICAGT